MTPDDPRHGTHAGAMAHRTARQTPCDPCRTAKARADKHRRVYGSQSVDLTPEAWAIIRDTELRLLTRSTGVSEWAFINIRKKQGRLRVYRRTLEAVLSMQPITDIGLRRRVRALAALGWSARDIAPHAGLHHEAILKLQRPGERQYVCSNVRDGVVAAYEELHMRRPAATKWTAANENRAARAGWMPPLAWDNIDDPDETPSRGTKRSRRKTDVDEIVVARVLNGDASIDTTIAEKREAMARWLNSGRSEKSLCDLTGWGANRYLPEPVSA